MLRKKFAERAAADSWAAAAEVFTAVAQRLAFGVFMLGM